jgi:hypothetical protein
MARRPEIEAGAILAAVLMTAPAAAGAPAGEETRRPSASCAGVEAEAVLALFEGRPDEPVRRFRARRRMHAEGLGRRAFMEVLVELDPEGALHWTVTSEGGSELIRTKAFRGMLEREADFRKTERPEGTALSAENYELAVDGREGDGLVRLRAVPRRRDAGLLDGRFVVTSETADLVRVEGRLVRNPSFWVTRVDVVRQFRRVGGHRVVVRIESVSRIRLLGPVRLTVDFDYEMIDGDEVGPSEALSPTTFMARTASPPAADPGPRPDR